MLSRSRHPLVVLTALAASLLLAGCQQSPRASASVEPSLDELPRLNGVERTLPIDVVVEGGGDAPRRRLVADYREPELTEEEKVALGPKPYNAAEEELRFYRRPRDPSHGVSPEESRVVIAADGSGGPSVWRDASRSRVVLGERNDAPGYIDSEARTQALFYSIPELIRALGPESRVVVGEDFARTHARRHRSVQD